MDAGCSACQNALMASDLPPKALPSSVLLVEDNPVIAMNTEALLLDLGVEDVRTAGSVGEALDLIETMAFDFAILDFKLGDDENSLPIAQRLSGTGTPIAFATGLGDDWDLPEGFGTAVTLRKPYGFQDLERVIRGD